MIGERPSRTHPPRAFCVALAGAFAAITGPVPAQVIVPIPDSVPESVIIEAPRVIRTSTAVEAITLDVGTGHPDRVALAYTASLVRPRATAVTLAPTPDPYVTPEARHVERIANPHGLFGGDTLAIALVEDPRGGAMIAIGSDLDNDGLPSPGEEVCRAASVDFVATCSMFHLHDSWAMAWTPLDGDSPVVVTTGVAGDAGSVGVLEGRTWISAAGRSDAEGRVRTRWSTDAPMMPDGGMGFGVVVVDLEGDLGVGSVAHRTVVPIRIVRGGLAQVPRALSVAPFTPTPEIRVGPGAFPDAMIVDVPPGVSFLELLLSADYNVKGGSLAVWRDPAPDYGGPAIPAFDRTRPDVLTGRKLSFASVFDGELGGRWYVAPIHAEATPRMMSVYASVGSTTSTEPVEVRAGSYYNPARPGHGVFLHFAGDEIVMLWYAYDENGDPTWYYAQGERLAPAVQRYELALYRTAWLGDRQLHYPVGRIFLNGLVDGELVMSWQLHARTGSERLVRFLEGCPQVDGAPLDVAAHWFDPARSGTGYSVAVMPGYEFLAAYVYDGLGQPRFLAAERPGAFDAADEAIELHQLRGFGPFDAWRTPDRTPVGMLHRRYLGGAFDAITIDADFTDGVVGSWNVVDAVQPLTATQGCAP